MTIFSQIRSVFLSRDGKVLVENFISLSVLQVAGYIFPLITMPYLAKVIGPEGFGKIAFASAIMVWIQCVADWGFHFTAARDIARCRDDIKKVSCIFSNVLWARCLLMILSFVALSVLIFLVPKFRDNAIVIFISFLMVPGHILFPDWFFQAMEKMKYITILNVLSKFLFTVAVFIFIKDKEDYVLQPLLMSCGFFVSGIIAMYFIFAKWNLTLCKPDLVEIKKTIKNSSDVFINNLMPNLYNSFSTVLLGFWGGSSAAGLLDAGNRFVQICQQLMQVVSRTFFPFLSRKIEKHTLFAKWNIVLALLMSLGLFIAAPLLIHLFFTSEFEPSIQLLRIMSFSIIFLMLSNVYGTNYLILQGCEKELRRITTVVSVIGFVLAFPLVYYGGFVGAAINIAVTRGILGFSIMIKALNVKSRNI